MQFILIRHGQSVANAINSAGQLFFTGQWDCPLTDLGREQAAALRGNPLLDGMDICYCSDLLRARETALGFMESGMIHPDARLRERSLGVFDGKAEAELRRDDRYSAYFSDPEFSQFRHGFSVRAPGGENYTDVCRRVGSLLAEIRQMEYGKVVLVSHYCAIRCIMRELQGLSDEETLSIRVPNCSPILVDVP